MYVITTNLRLVEYTNKTVLHHHYPSNYFLTGGAAEKQSTKQPPLWKRRIAWLARITTITEKQGESHFTSEELFTLTLKT